MQTQFDNVYTHNFEIYCETNQVQQLVKVRHLTKWITTQYPLIMQ